MNFLNNVAIFYDKEKSNREKIYVYWKKNNSWKEPEIEKSFTCLEEYMRHKCSENNIEYSKLYNLIQPVIKDIQHELIDNFEGEKRYQLSPEYIQGIMDIFNETFPEDPNNVIQWDIPFLGLFYYLNIENNYTLVVKDDLYFRHKDHGWPLTDLYFNENRSQ